MITIPYASYSTGLAYLATFGLLIYSIVILRRQRIPMAAALLCVSLVVIIWSFFRYFMLEVFMAWFGFVGAYISGRNLKKVTWRVALAILVIELGCAILTRNRISWFMSPGEYAAFGLMSIGLFPYPAWISYSIPAIALLATISRSAWVSLAGAASLRYAPKWAPLLAPVALGLVFIRPDTVAKRLLVWREAVEIFLTSPLWGHGTGSYHWLARFQPMSQHADNLPLTLLVEFGIIGSLAFAYLFYEIVKKTAGEQLPTQTGADSTAVHATSGRQSVLRPKRNHVRFVPGAIRYRGKIK